jgi:hypothetical protein
MAYLKAGLQLSDELFAAVHPVKLVVYDPTG